MELWKSEVGVTTEDSGEYFHYFLRQIIERGVCGVCKTIFFFGVFLFLEV